jgi:CheY-like chemotaxis protein
MADPGQLEQVIMNLVANARDAMPRGGKLLIETSDIIFGLSDTGRLLSSEIHEYVLLTVSDTGTGMTDDVQQKMFDPFFTTKELGKGTGLGLSTVYGIVRQHKGDMCVDSAPGRGTIFKVFLPALMEARVNKAGCGAALVGGAETILLVDDDPGVRTVVSALLSHLGYRVHEAPGAREALRFGSEHREPIHALLTDVIMPEMNGRQLAESFGLRHPETAVLYMSGHADQAIARHGILDPGVNFIQKPVVVSTLAQKLREVLDAS